MATTLSSPLIGSSGPDYHVAHEETTAEPDDKRLPGQRRFRRPGTPGMDVEVRLVTVPGVANPAEEIPNRDAVAGFNLDPAPPDLDAVALMHVIWCNLACRYPLNE